MIWHCFNIELGEPTVYGIASTLTITLSLMISLNLTATLL
jgi:hypothetical protein